MVATKLPWVSWAGLIGIPTNRDDGFNVLLEELVHVLGRVGGDVDPDLVESLDG